MTWPYAGEDRLTVVETTLATLSQQMGQVIARLDRVRELLTGHMITDVPGLLAEGRAWGDRLEAGIGDLDTRVAALEAKPAL